MSSKIYKNYILLKINNPEKIYLFRSGIFCTFVDEDAKLMSKVLNLKLGYLTPDIVKCGFPYKSLDKYMEKLRNLNYDVNIVDPTNNSIFNYTTFLDNINIKNFLSKCSTLQIDNLSISQMYETLTEIKKSADEILKGMH